MTGRALLEGEPGVEEPLRLDLLVGEEELSASLLQGEVDEGRRRLELVRSPEFGGELLLDLVCGRWRWTNQVVCALRVVGLEQESQRTDLISKADPRPVLSAVAELKAARRSRAS